MKLIFLILVFLESMFIGVWKVLKDFRISGLEIICNWSCLNVGFLYFREESVLWFIGNLVFERDIKLIVWSFSCYFN